jgi:DNA-directed RNA polymerase specialized sigma24 family protein
VARRILKDDDAKDAVQDAFISAYRCAQELQRIGARTDVAASHRGQRRVDEAAT